MIIDAAPASTVCYLAIGKPFTRIEDRVRIGELLQLALMGRAKRFFGEDAIKRFGIEDQIRKECRERGVPEPIGFEHLMTIKVGNQVHRSIHFHRFRNKRGLLQPDRKGSFWRLTFANPIMGPLALGFGCHFGLGLFQPNLQAGRG